MATDVVDAESLEAKLSDLNIDIAKKYEETQTIENGDLPPEGKDAANEKLLKKCPDPVVSAVSVSIPHVEQSYHWDCGLACVKMILEYLGESYDKLEEMREELNFKESVWTIDLAYIIKAYQMKCMFCTVTLGVDPGYSNEHFYAKVFSVDERRVTKLFEDAPEKGIVVENRSVSLDEILDHLSQNQLVIVLIDWSHIRCVWCEGHLCGLCGFRSCVRCTGSFQGHFIVLCGLDKKKQLIYFHDPAKSKRLCACYYNVLEDARMQYGTDEDILFIYDQ